LRLLADEQSEYRGVKDKKPLTLEKKEHETLTLGKKATRAWKKGRKKDLKDFPKDFVRF
jgi:hypothetical protein